MGTITQHTPGHPPHDVLEMIRAMLCFNWPTGRCRVFDSAPWREAAQLGLLETVAPGGDADGIPCVYAELSGAGQRWAIFYSAIMGDHTCTATTTTAR